MTVHFIIFGLCTFKILATFTLQFLCFQLKEELSNLILSNLKPPRFFQLDVSRFSVSKLRKNIRLNIGRTSITSWLDLDKIEIFSKLYLDFAMDSGKSGQNQGHHVIEHHLINKSRGDYFFEKFSFFWDSIWDMLLPLNRAAKIARQRFAIIGTELKIPELSKWKPFMQSNHHHVIELL